MAYLDLTTYKEKLLEERQILLERIGRRKMQRTNQDILNPDHTDLAQTYDQQQRRSALQEQTINQLNEVNKALQRIDQNSYGKCVNCGQQINAERLSAIPSSALCIKCKQKEEAGSKIYSS